MPYIYQSSTQSDHVLTATPVQTIDIYPNPPILTVTKLPSIDFVPRSRKRKAAMDLKPTQKNKRIKELNKMKQYAEETVGMTFEQANITRPKLAIHEALQLHQAARNKLRKATKSIRIPSTTTINLELKQWAIEFATETRSFNDPVTKLAGAYFTNPLKLIEIVTESNRKFTVSADKGGDWLKIGIIVLNSTGKSQFLCLLVVMRRID